MKVFLFNKEKNDVVNKIMQLIDLRKDGEVAELMKSKENAYELSYGVLVKHLKQIASEFDDNNDVAERLFCKNVREAKIIAIMLVDISGFSKESCKQWISELNTPELAEYFAQYLLSKVNYRDVIINDLIKHDKTIYQALGYWSLGWMIREKHLEVISRISSLLENKSLLINDEASYYYRSVIFMLRHFIRNSSIEKEIAKKWLYNQPLKEDYNVKLVLEEIRTEIDYGV